MSKLEALREELKILDAFSQPSPEVAQLIGFVDGIEAAIAKADDEHCERVDALQELIKAEQQQHKSKRDSMGADLARTKRRIEESKKEDAPKQAELAKMAQAIATKFGKSLPELRQLLIDMGD